jgi:hypothetical protein
MQTNRKRTDTESQTKHRNGSHHNWVGIAPLVMFLLWTVTFGDTLSPWWLGWSIAFGLLYSFKWLTWWRVRLTMGQTTRFRTVGYLLMYPGMDAQAFLNTEAKPPKPTGMQYLSSIAQTGLGAGLLWGVVRFLPPDQLLLINAVSILGLVFLWLAGFFHLVALLWQQGGVDAPHIMNRPLFARSVGQFWGERWNLACHKLLYDLVFRPVLRRFGHLKVAVLASFFASGLVHDLVISYPVKGGFGLPTTYFMIQGFGLLIEHSKLGKRLKLRRGWVGWLFTAAVTLGPVQLLFHRPFIERGVMPFLQAIGAL